LKSGTETLKSIWFLVFRTKFCNISAIFQPIVGSFFEHFKTKGFSTVSLGNPVQKSMSANPIQITKIRKRKNEYKS
jgi:hypothetical protein